MSAEVPKKFIPKRRAPYLMQQEVVKKNSDAPVIKHEAKNITKDLKEKKADSVFNAIKDDTFSDNIEGYNGQLAKVTGIQKRLLNFFMKCCVNNKNNITGPLTLDALCSVGDTTKKTLKTIITRMIKKDIIQKVDSKKGKGGFVVFSVDKKILDVVLKKETK